MSLTLQLPPELEAELAAESRQLGISLSEYVLRLLAGRRNVGPALHSGAELMAYWQREGLVRTRVADTDSRS